MPGIKRKKSGKLRKFISPAVLLAAFIALAAQGYYSPISKGKTSIVATRIIDGDTLETSTGAKVRLASIDSPEFPKGCLSLQAKERLENLVKGKKVTAVKIETDNFGRDVAYIYVKDLFVNKALVAEGWAQLDHKTKETLSTTEIEQAEREAKSAKRGIWSNECENTQKSDCVIKGNYRKDNDTKIYHLPECYNYEKIIIDTFNRDRWFCTEQEATQAGFVKSQDCPIE